MPVRNSFVKKIKWLGRTTSKPVRLFHHCRWQYRSVLSEVHMHFGEAIVFWNIFVCRPICTTCLGHAKLHKRLTDCYMFSAEKLQYLRRNVWFTDRFRTHRFSKDVGCSNFIPVTENLKEFFCCCKTMRILWLHFKVGHYLFIPPYLWLVVKFLYN